MIKNSEISVDHLTLWMKEKELETNNKFTEPYQKISENRRCACMGLLHTI
jgi:hypothetical protein